ncbi:MAG: NAD(P)H-hydrate dehydratase [Elusimicrobia bacterium]|nr:NAD(P)H-hydrate dehydratase [Elusimicrobiota bacterium]
MKPLSKAELRECLVRREPADHKGTFGHALIVAGSRNMAGAAVLAARAALRSGAGLVTAAVPAGVQPLVAGAAPEALTLGLPENAAGCLRGEAVSRLQAAHERTAFDVMALGPGLSREPDTAKFVVLALSSLPLPAVVDADALNNLAAQDHAGVRQLLSGRGQPCVFTPHPGEMARCLALSVKQVAADRAGCAERLSREWRGTVLLKGRGTLIFGGGRGALNSSGGPALARGGTGDVLTGLIAGLWAQLLASGRGKGDMAFRAAALGAWLHGRAGELARRQRTVYALTAQDVVENLAGAFKELAA